MFSLRNRNTAVPRQRTTAKYHDNWEGRYRNGRVACNDYTQLREHAASTAEVKHRKPSLDSAFGSTSATLQADCYTN
jgi:hypothetical protein